jgi:Protein similar to CwfJ C-terminus 1
MNKILDNCPLCYREDTNMPPIAPVVSLATRVYLTLPTEPELSEGGACITPIQHRVNLLECDDDEWEEIRVSWAPNQPLFGSINLFIEFHEKSHKDVSRSRARRNLLRKRSATAAEETCSHGGCPTPLQPWGNGTSLFQSAFLNPSLFTPSLTI